jgi:protein tyrosine phosphatase (PTP) superfamily phosphohydrolase (DUF442 family)
VKPRARRILIALAMLGIVAAGAAVVVARAEVRVRPVVPGRLVRGAWQPPAALESLIRREKIRTVVTLTAINTHDPKYVAQKPVLDAAGVRWVLIPMRGSTATLDQMSEAADLLADPALQPVFFHCVGGHHRTSLAHAAYRIRYSGYSADEAWAEIAALPWTRPDAPRDRQDQGLIRAFAVRESGRRLAHAPEHAR